jgi:hypothetical protein
MKRRQEDPWNFLFIAGMWFQDLFNYDFRRTEMCIIPYATQQGEISFCAYNTGVGWRKIIENMHKNATVAQWYKNTASTRSTPRARAYEPQRVRPGTHSLKIDAEDAEARPSPRARHSADRGRRRSPRRTPQEGHWRKQKPRSASKLNHLRRAGFFTQEAQTRRLRRADRWRAILGLSSVWVFTGEVVASFVVPLLINTRYPYPSNFAPFRFWARTVLAATAIAIALSCLGKTRARPPIVAGSIATRVRWFIVVSME